MHRMLDKYMDVLILIVLMAISAALTLTGINRVSGLAASIGYDKANSGGNAVQYPEVMQYHLSDILLSNVLVEDQSPCDMMVITYPGSESKPLWLHLNRSDTVLQNDNPLYGTVTEMDVATFFTDRYKGAKAIMKMKPEGMSTQEWYNLPVKVTLEYNKDSNYYKYLIEIGVTAA